MTRARGTLRAVARRSDTRLLVLHWLRLKGQASVAAVAESAEIATAEVESWLARLAADGLVVHRDVPEGWSLTPAGRAEHARLVGREIDAVGVRPTIEGAYERFRALNGAVLDACSRWLEGELRALAPALIVCLGATPPRAQSSVAMPVWARSGAA